MGAVADITCQAKQVPSKRLSMIIKNALYRVVRVPRQRALHEYRLLRDRFSFRKFGRTAKERFYYYYKNNTWANLETVSGPGSTIEYTENIRREIPIVLERYHIKRILDAPCGDYNWFRLIHRDEETEYIGGDIVAPLVDSNQAKYANSNTSFITIDITKDPLPSADLWICRDCLMHFSNQDTFLAFENFLRSAISYILTSTYPESWDNSDIVTGDHHNINLEKPPFNLCKPIIYIDDWIEGWAVRRLGLWHRRMLLDSLASNKAYRHTVSRVRMRAHTIT